MVKIIFSSEENINAQVTLLWQFMVKNQTHSTVCWHNDTISMYVYEVKSHEAQIYTSTNKVQMSYLPSSLFFL